jgi:hypothetical protein
MNSLQISPFFYEKDLLKKEVIVRKNGLYFYAAMAAALKLS